jgi:hypothetical protein
MFRSFILSNIEQYHFLRLQIGGVAELGIPRRMGGANVDVQIILDHEQAIRYLVKYVSKPKT